MAREVTAGHQQLRQSERSPDTSGKFDVGYTDDSGKWHHICRYSHKGTAYAAAERLDEPDEEAQNLIGLTGDEEIEVLSR